MCATGRVHLLVVAIFFLTGVWPAQQKNERTTSKGHLAVGAITGRVFAITEAGELKPARFAKVYLLFSNKISGSKVVDDVEETPYIIFLKNYTDTMNRLRAERMDAYSRALEVSDQEGKQTFCKWDLIEVDHAIVDTLAWAEANKRTDLLPAETDEEGHFSLKALKQGAYQLIVRGQAGLNDAYWEQPVWVHTGESVSVKISSVKKACLKR